MTQLSIRCVCWYGTLAAAVALGNVGILLADDWRQFRGTDSTSVAAGSTLPIEFGPEKNIAWKTELPGKGVSAPIVVGDRVYLTASSGPVTQNRLHVLCYDAATGKQLWQRQFWATGRCFHHPTSANAAPTPASDGERIFAFYSSNDLVCLDLDGNLLWYRGLGSDYPQAGNDVGMSSSPLVVGDTVIVQIESQGESLAAGINVATGETRWKIERDREANWTSPTVLHPKDGPPLVLLQSAKGLTALNARTGEEVWQYKVPAAGISSATPVGDRIYLPARGLTVLEADGAEPPELAWDANRLGPGNASPVVYRGRVYIVPRSGLLNCGDAETGDVVWQLRISGTFWATPVIAGDHIYCANQDGQVHVVKLGGDKGLVAAKNELDDRFLASPAVANNALYLRGDHYLWKIAQN